MRFFDFIEQDYAVRLSSDLFGQLTALLVADIARRGADKTGNRVLFHKFRHIKADYGVFVAEHRRTECFAKLSFADARRT